MEVRHLAFELSCDVCRSFAAELYPTEVRATGASHVRLPRVCAPQIHPPQAAACSRLGGACASLLVIARFSYARLHVGGSEPSLASLIGPLALTSLLAALIANLIPVDTAQKPAVEAPLLPAKPRQRRRSSDVSRARLLGPLPPGDDGDTFTI